MKSKKRQNKKKTIAKRKQQKVLSSKRKKTTKKKTTTKKITTPKKVSVVKKEEVSKKKDINYKGIALFIFVLLINTLAIIGVNSLKKEPISPILSVDKVYLEDSSKVVVDYSILNPSEDDKVYCFYTTKDNLIDLPDSGWVLSENNRCEYTLDKNVYYTYVKLNEDSIIFVRETAEFGIVNNLKINKSKYYLALKDTLNLKVTYDTLGNVSDSVEWTSSDNSIANVVDGKVTAKKDGTAIITASIKDKSISSTITVTSLITKRPKNGFDFNKKNLGCNIYTKKQNDLLDTILKFKVNEVGYKTRAAVVEAARFLTLDFPYRINYFYENGRLTKKRKIDGEGRYYHKGLYLDESRYSSIGKSRKGPGTWGCMVYSIPDHKKSRNGLDCSGFVTWALLNGGFNPGDIGAGITKVKDLTDLGVKKKITSTLAKGNTIKVGDLLHNRWSGGHIAIIVGIDSNYYYVAQAVWFDEVGVIINKYKKADLKNKFREVILMDKYYKKDGNLTNMW